MVVHANVSLRQRKHKLDTLLEMDEPLEEECQEDVVSMLECEAMNHCHRWQSAMAVLSFTLGLLMIIAGVRQLLHPWDLQHHAFFNGALSDTWVSAGELLSGASYILTGCLFFKHFSLPNCHVTGPAAAKAGQRGQTLLSLPTMVVAFGAAISLLWAHAIYDTLKVHDRPGSSMLQYSWLPLGPALYAFLACQVSGMLGSTLADTQKLRQQMYAHKTA
ncbi:hypothetical protein CVIRNUC_004881 [Coccomyxa viridis]|uniref:Uncharacterized protein n=1 Tax=Coccomyxa viridis TaxID=1274662 RepID=A0AAV1I3M0_9CHLO|nr:hypothetical protein CVIRNUC_004881 [Coccomyxa viridis]